MRAAIAGILLASLAGLSRAQAPVFSGPQPGEKLASFKVRRVFEPDAGKEIDFVDAAHGKPIVLVFVHEMNRQSIAMVRTLTSYTHSRAKDGLATGVVWLSDDATEAENALNRIKHALTEGTPIGISLEGKEGPGSYGLNRKVMLTILVGNKDKVTANFALVQPSLQVDLPKILAAVVKEAGGKAPSVESLTKAPPNRPDAPKGPDAALRTLIRPVIQINATPEEVDKAAKAVEDYVAKNDAARSEVGRIASSIIDAGKLDNYGTPRARDYLKKWAKEFGKAKQDKPAAQKPS